MKEVNELNINELKSRLNILERKSYHFDVSRPIQPVKTKVQSEPIRPTFFGRLVITFVFFVILVTLLFMFPLVYIRLLLIEKLSLNNEIIFLFVLIINLFIQIYLYYTVDIKIFNRSVAVYENKIDKINQDYDLENRKYLNQIEKYHKNLEEKQINEKKIEIKNRIKLLEETNNLSKEQLLITSELINNDKINVYCPNCGKNFNSEKMMRVNM